uniref:Uncharacterized protein n=1 Tax=Anopheles maculatus TaxID=74869 RepID=A0A182S8C1_9DIPT
MVGRGGVVSGCGVSTVSSVVGWDAWDVGNVGSAADQQVSAALDMRCLGGVSVDNRGRVVSVSSVVRGGGMAVSVGGCVVSSLGGCLVLGRCWVVGHGTNDDDGKDDCCYDGVHGAGFGGGVGGGLEVTLADEHCSISLYWR